MLKLKSTSTTYPARAYRSVIDQMHTDRRVKELPLLARQLRAGLFNDTDDSAPLFADLPRISVMTAALADADVAWAVARLPRGWQW